MATVTTRPDEEVQAIAAEQRRELMAAKALESDLDLAFQLQMQEAITASLSPRTPTQQPPELLQSDNNSVFNFSALQTEELEKLELECSDRLLSESEMKLTRTDLYRRIHDYHVAREIHRMPEDEWEEWGDNFERPFGEGSSSSASKGGTRSDAISETFRVYFKALLSEERVGDSNVSLAGIGIAICDSRDGLIFELRKPLLGSDKSRLAAEFKALIEGLNAALTLDLMRVVFYCDCYPMYQFIRGRWSPRQRKMVTLVNQVSQLQKRFTYCVVSFVARRDIKFAFKLAREAIDSQINKPPESCHANCTNETCVICLEDTPCRQIFEIDDCSHRYCVSCMKQHVEVKLLHGMVPQCPHERCYSELKIESCKTFLPPKLIEIMSQRLKEASIPVTEKVYCPFPKCSALMSKREALEYSKNAFVGAEQSGARRCTKCNGLFCVNCKVPWHKHMSCVEYKRINPGPLEDAKLKTLADRNLWRQCIKCNHMIELAAGCYHMTCRCGYEFCYTCGAEWKNKKATCSCPLWDEDNILYDEEGLSDDDDYDDDEDDFNETDSDDYYW